MSATDLSINVRNQSSTFSRAPKKPSKNEILKSLSVIRSVRDLNVDAIRDILRRHTKDEELEVVEMSPLEDMSGCNDAFNSSIVGLIVKISYTKRSNDDSIKCEENVSLIIKSPPKSQFVRMMHKFTKPFYNEVSWYLDLVHQLELANGENCMKNCLPVCYHAHSQYFFSDDPTPSWCETNCPWFCFVPCRPPDSGILILENVMHRPGKTFRMFDKHKSMDEPHVRIVMKALAHFHGRWLKYKFMSQAGQLNQGSGFHRQPMSWKSFETRYGTQKRVPKLVFNQLKSVAEKTVLRVLEKKLDLEEGDQAELHGLSNQCQRFFHQEAPRILNEYLTRAPTPIFTLCHGDFWSNNIMFSYDDGFNLIEDDDPILLDFQLINYGHPCFDLVYFLYLNTDLTFRDQHLQAMLGLYYQTFSAYVQIEAIYLPDKFSYSFDDFMADYRWHTSIGFVTALAVMPNVMSDEEVNIDGNLCTAFQELQRKQINAVIDNNLPHSKEIRRRMIDLVKEMARSNII